VNGSSEADFVGGSAIPCDQNRQSWTPIGYMSRKRKATWTHHTVCPVKWNMSGLVYPMNLSSWVSCSMPWWVIVGGLWPSDWLFSPTGLSTGVGVFECSRIRHPFGLRFKGMPKERNLYEYAMRKLIQSNLPIRYRHVGLRFDGRCMLAQQLPLRKGSRQHLVLVHCFFRIVGW